MFIEDNNVPSQLARPLPSKLVHIGLRLIGSEGKLGRQRHEALQNVVSQPDALVMQVGANDGEFDDPLHDFLANPELRAVLIEPQQRPFERLQRRYEERPNVNCVQAAIAPAVGTLTLYRPHFGNENDRFGEAIARENREQVDRVMRRHPLRARGGYTIEAEKVSALPLSRVMRQAGVVPNEISAFFCDAEGADVGITHQLLDSNARPAVIQYEQVASPVADTTDLNSRLVDAGYVLTWSYRDILAIKSSC